MRRANSSSSGVRPAWLSTTRTSSAASLMATCGAGLQPGLYQCKSQAGIGLAAEELAGACSADEFSGVNNGAAAAEDGFGRALDLDAFEHGIVHAHVMRFRADEFFVVGIEEHEVGVRAHGDSALARVEAKQFCGRGGDELDKAIRREVLAVDAAGVDQAEAVLDAWSAVRNFREVVLAEFLLLLEAERAMVGRDDLQRVFREALPKFFLMPLFPERRGENVFRALEAGNVEILDGEI